MVVGVPVVLVVMLLAVMLVLVLVEEWYIVAIARRPSDLEGTGDLVDDLLDLLEARLLVIRRPLRWCVWGVGCVCWGVVADGGGPKGWAVAVAAWVELARF